jgi:hypothetical protein
MSNNNTQIPADPKWKLILHEQGEDPYYEITNGPISICAPCGFWGETEEEEDTLFKKVADALNESGIDFHSENALELKQHIENMELQNKLEDLKAKGEKLAVSLRRCSLSMNVHPDYEPNSEFFDRVESAHEALAEWKGDAPDWQTFTTEQARDSARATIEDIILSAGKHCQEECSEIADAILSELSSIVRGSAVWVKASERLPEKCGKDNTVVVRGKWEGKWPFVTYGFRNYNEEDPRMYYEVGSKSECNNDVEWLDESAGEKEVKP